MFKKKFGQNFLNNNLISKEIVNTQVIKDKNILEIGCGNLALTNEIIKKKPKKFVCVEIDKDLIKKNINHELSNFILNDNALTFNELNAFKNEKFSIISNLPFNISNTLLVKWINLQNQYGCIEDMTLMFQKELAERIVATENTKKYGRITLLSQAFFQITKKIEVKKKEFFPVPKVDALVLKFSSLNNKYIKVKNLKKLEEISRLFFNDRRKKNEKKIKKIFSDKKIMENNYNIYFNLRAENIKKEIYYQMANEL